ncbi:hypothetical protein PPYR_02636 [Photinus pyralis]|uniref:Uncharacterized protein n=1 Tax=Photinus pyralis TaxID=7054 RepID=A0A1Y1N5G2_PHOPY|nr:hypothetical protein PPYR_02636 [Photinus pyralis]
MDNRQRSNSITSYYKRKPLDTSLEENSPFAKSKKVSRSPDKTSTTSAGSMEKIEKMLDSVVSELKLIRAENAQWKEDISKMQEEMKKNEQKWQLTVNSLEEKIESLERKLQWREKLDKKNNIVIKGLSACPGNEERIVEELLQGKLKVSVKPKEVLVLGKDKRVMLVKFDSWKDKQEVMCCKQKLKENLDTKKVYINNDMTTEELKTQAKIKEVAESLQADGKRTKIGYRKLFVDGKLWYWDNKADKLLESKN